MKTLGIVRRAVVVAAVALLSGATTYAEVGVVVDSQRPDLKNPYVLGIITDDPDPLGTWIPFEPGLSARVALNPTGDVNGDGKPSIVRNHVSGLAVVAWSRNSPSGYDVVVSHFAGGSWSGPEVLAGSPSDEREPFLTIDPADGTFHVVYWIDDAFPRVMHRQAPADLSSWSAPVQVSQAGENACVPSAAVHEGALRVVYEIHDLGVGLAPRQIAMATADAGGFVREILSTTWHAGKNWPEVHSAAGVLWVDWVDADDEMAWLRRDPQTGVWEPVRTEGYGSIEERDYHVRGGIRFKAWD